jgi:hypothetical protein
MKGDAIEGMAPKATKTRATGNGNGEVQEQSLLKTKEILAYKRR